MLDSKIKNEEILNSNIQKLNQDLYDSKDTIIKLNKELEWISNLNKEGKDEFNHLNQKLNKMKENEEFLQQRINNLEFDLTDSQKAEKSQRNLHLKDVMKQNIRVSFLEKEFSRASEEISGLKDILHKKTSEILEGKEQIFIKEQEIEKTK